MSSLSQVQQQQQQQQQQSPYGHINNNTSLNSNNSSHNIQPEYDEFEEGENEQDVYDEGALLVEDDNVEDSEEDTEEASETEMGSGSNHRNMDEPIEIKEQMYQDKLATLKKQLEELRSGTHPEYVRRVKKLEQQCNERIRLNEIYREYLINCVERDYILEKNAAVKEYEEKKIDLRENLITDFEDRRKMIETERATMELTGDSVDVKPTVTRKLRRRPNEPLPVPEKRRKPTTGQLVLLLDEKEVENDLKLISRGKAVQVVRPHTISTSSTGNGSSSHNTNNAAPLTNLSSTHTNNYQLNNCTGGTSNSNDTGVPPSPSPTVSLQQNQTVSHSVANNLHTGGQSQANNQNQNSHQTQQQQQPPPPPPPPVPQSNNQSPSNSIQQQQQQQQSAQPLVETKIEDGKLLYERRWFHRGQPVYVEATLRLN
ncbi:uncharacterized protein DDB_G0284459 isoform X2 [Toxorhynchites rutilus septentrionalis]|uniref:uncharacterized protein DDB_G0284459 isoform X2 n=1 Tax=Toxorhynchites rutilus septentrionalis TaxID=329112 RepID=UPI0024783E33|nr:uncharacterized protein DDB_G0284459 isoform X2 [Toxorhynchites rutilus septentrionalis]